MACDPRCLFMNEILVPSEDFYEYGERRKSSTMASEIFVMLAKEDRACLSRAVIG